MSTFHIDSVARSLEHFLKRRRTPVSSSLLRKIVSVCYYASIQTEEGRSTVATLGFADSRPSSSDASLIPYPDRPTTHEFENSIALTVHNLVKTAPSASPSCSQIMIHASRGRPFICGLADQQLAYQQSVENETNAYFSPPGLFQIDILGAGTIQVRADRRHIATLREDRIIRADPDVLANGPVADLLLPYGQAVAKRALAIVRRETGSNSVDAENRSSLVSAAMFSWEQALRRILLGIQRQKHGGAVLLIPRHNWAHLKPKYALSYRRLEEILSHSVAQDFLPPALRFWYATDGPQEVITDQYLLRRALTGLTKKDSYVTAESGAISFIASMASVDGLLLFENGLNVAGYGVEITRRTDPPSLLIARDAAGRRVSSETKPTDFGTRHRSMMRYAYAMPGSVGFVVSQDGYVRCIARINERLIMWENIRLRDLD